MLAAVVLVTNIDPALADASSDRGDGGRCPVSVDLLLLTTGRLAGRG
jgi:hypothetical protein